MPDPLASPELLIPFKRGSGTTTAERSQRMAQVRQAKTAPEEAVAVWLRAHRLHYRRNVRTLPGRPDFANRSAGFAIFVHGCFWHRHPGCPRATTPRRNRGFWLEKFASNIARDAARTAELEQSGINAVVVWECETENPMTLDNKLASLLPSPDAHAASQRRTTDLDASGPSVELTMVARARGARAHARARTEGADS